MAHDILLFGLVGDFHGFCNGMMDPWDWYICLYLFVVVFPGVFSCIGEYIYIYNIYIFHVPWILWQIYLLMVSYGEGFDLNPKQETSRKKNMALGRRNPFLLWVSACFCWGNVS